MPGSAQTSGGKVAAISNDRRNQVDSLRILAILCVLFDHYVDLATFRIGTVSVRFFLILSGFLITRTLIRYVSPYWADNSLLLKSFYGRRALRIWPLHYLLLTTLLLVGLLPLPYFLVHGAFLTNILQAWRNDWNQPWFFSALWTISVQEQFYLFWPLLFIALRASARSAFLVGMIGVALLFRGGMWAAGMGSDVAFFTLPFASFDALAAGSLLAMAQGRLTPWLAHGVRALPILLVICLIVELQGGHFFPQIILPTLWLVPLGILTLAAFEDRLGAFGSLLNLPPLIFLGRISLGVYLLHLPVWLAFMKGSPAWLLPLVAQPSFSAFAILAPATLVTATASWLWFEKPLQRFRKKLPYRRPSAQPPHPQPQSHADIASPIG